MRTSVPRYLTGTVTIVLWVGMLALCASDHTEGVHYKPKSLKEQRGKLINPSQMHREEVIPNYPDEEEIVIQAGKDQHYALQPYMMAIQSIPVDIYRSAMSKARTHYDVFRIFLPGGDISDEDIDRMMWSMAAQPKGLSGFMEDSGAYFIPGILHAPHTSNTALVPINKHNFHLSDVNYDVMMSDGPICNKCRSIQGGVGFGQSSLAESRKRRLQTDSWRRRKRRHKPSKNRHVFMKRCKKRRRAIAANIKKCRKQGNRKRCKMLRDRYQELRKNCKRNSQNQSIIPDGKVILQDHQQARTTESPAELSGSNSNQEMWQQWEMTSVETQDLGQCGSPVPQVVRVRDVLGAGDEEYYPSCVLRFRCRTDSGCCQHEFQACAAIATEKIPKTVLVAKAHSHNVYFQNQTMKTILVDNDTKCGCIDVLAPKEIRCPYPFVYDIPKQQCQCTEYSFERSCKMIRRGKELLMPTEKKCIENGKCRPLDNCYYGPFDMTTYKCPVKPDISGSGVDQIDHPGQPKRKDRGRS